MQVFLKYFWSILEEIDKTRVASCLAKQGNYKLSQQVISL
jgi:hypothetical protein